MLYRICFTLFTALFLFLGQMGWSQEKSYNIEFILDASNSMNEKNGSETKIDIAKRVLINLLQNMESEDILNTQIGLRIYGNHFDPQGTKEKACTDSTLEIPIKNLEIKKISSLVQSIEAKGYTPIAYSLQQTANDFEDIQGEKTVVLVSDGEESCGGDPCEAAKKLKEQGILTKIHVVGFDVSGDARKQLECIAQGTGGLYFSADSPEELSKALTAVKENIIVKKESSSVRIKASSPGILHFEIPSWIKDPPYDYSVYKISDHSLFSTVKQNLDDLKLAPGQYKIIWRQCEHGCPKINLSEKIEIISEKTTTLKLSTGFAFIPSEWIQKEPPEQWSLKNLSLNDLGIKYEGTFGPVVIPPGKYELWYQQYEHGSNKTLLAKEIEIKEGELTQFDLNTGVKLIPMDPKATPPYKWVVLDFDTHQPVLEGYTTYGPLPIAPGHYKLSIQQTEHGHTLTETISDFEIKSGQLAEIEM